MSPIVSVEPITVKDILTSSGKFPFRPRRWPPNFFQAENAAELVEKLNRVQISWGHQLVLSSGYRPKAVNDKTPGASPDSWHLDCAAADIEDPTGKLVTWVHVEEALLAHFGLWMEKTHRADGTKRSWVHFQIHPPASGERFFSGACREPGAPHA